MVYGESTPTIILGVKSHMDNTAKNEMQDVVWLMKSVQLSIGIDENEKYTHALQLLLFMLCTLLSVPMTTSCPFGMDIRWLLF